MNIYSTAPVSFAVAALGGDILIDTVDGKVSYTVKPGTQTDTKVRLKGKGVPSLRSTSVRGDHYVTLVVQTPVKLSNDAKKLLKEFDAATEDSLTAVERYKASKAGSDGDKTEKTEKKKRGFMK
jgi:molecular chaperone DnaJ